MRCKARPLFTIFKYLTYLEIHCTFYSCWLTENSTSVDFIRKYGIMPVETNEVQNHVECSPGTPTKAFSNNNRQGVCLLSVFLQITVPRTYKMTIRAGVQKI